MDKKRSSFFFALLLAGGLLSYAPLSAFPWTVLLLAGIALPVAWLMRGKPRAVLEGKDPLPPAPLWALGAALLGALFLRFAFRRWLFTWPMWDEGFYSFFAVDLAEKWHWQLFFGAEQDTPVYTWLQGLYYRWTGPSLEALWRYPAIYSILTVAMGYLAARRFFSRSLSFIYFLLLGFSFWPLYAGGFAGPIGIDLFWEFLALYVLGRFLEAMGSPGRVPWTWAAVLGILVGTGWYLSKLWITCIPLFVLAVLYAALIHFPGKRRVLGPFLAAFFLPLLPMLLLVAKGAYGAHLQSYFILSNHAPSPVGQWVVSLSYWTALFWGPLDRSYFNFGPLWGGFLNPVLGSFFWLGWAALFHARQRILFLGCLAALGLCLLPGCLSINLEFMRIVSVLPFLLAVVAVGIRDLMEALPRGRRAFFLCGALSLSLGLDLFHLAVPYHQWGVPGAHNSYSKSFEGYQAFLLLEKEAREKGPGCILTQFIPNPFDQTLLTAVYPFNAAENPRLDRGQASWVGVLVSDPQYRYLSHRFPSGQWYPLDAGLQRYDDSLYLGLLPLGPGFPLEDWVRTNKALRSTYPLVPYGQSHPQYATLLSRLLEIYPLSKTDPFLEACARERIANVQFSSGQLALYLRSVAPLLRSPFANSLLFRRQGTALLSLGFPREAKTAFATAARLNPLNRPPPEVLAELERRVREKNAREKP